MGAEDSDPAATSASTRATALLFGRTHIGERPPDSKTPDGGRRGFLASIFVV
jgi:hypothetical protein